MTFDLWRLGVGVSNELRSTRRNPAAEGPCAQDVFRVEGLSVASQLEVKMHAGGGSGLAREADEVAATHGVSVLNAETVEMTVRGTQTCPVLKRDVFAVARVPPCKGHDARPGGKNRLFEFRFEVNAGVEAVVAMNGVRAMAPRAGDYDWTQRPPEEVRVDCGGFAVGRGQAVGDQPQQSL